MPGRPNIRNLYLWQEDAGWTGNFSAGQDGFSQAG